MVRKSKLLGMFIGSLLIGYSSVSFAYNLDPYGGHWEKGVDYTYSIASSISDEGVDSIVLASDQWDTIRKKKFSLEYSGDRNKQNNPMENINGENEVFKIDMGTSQAPANARWKYSGDIITEGDIILNSSRNLSNSSKPSKTAYHVPSIMVHEFGHIIGLDHSDNKDAVMYVSPAGTVKYQLGKDDINGFNYRFCYGA
ncbi:matrixin family metalloprotease [Brevibacillus parabrevis]|jgi:hypothetical protein|uniref:matrixin family metalloprotease n=1 Tax=Brevibacillus parabrevis TaxID=54914 RepID=UPI002E1B4B0C|nr:matrixin family metalloprotease [Brevibacillus parabrevis]MED2257135.1 matrixin family metalloprotease [Brevibacillus parabrevis]